MQTGTDMSRLVEEIVANLDEIDQFEMIWKRGLVQAGGPHYRIKGTLWPVSIGEDECRVFGRLIEAFRPENCLIIGNAFGMSSVYIAKAMEHCGGRAVVTLDNKSEGEGERCFHIAAALRDRMAAKILTNKVGSSPEDVPNAADEDHYDLIFIDGDHTHPQVTRDFEAIGHLVRDDSIIVLHDYWTSGVIHCVDAVERAGFLCLKVNSSCEIVLGTKSPEVFAQLEELFPGSEKPRRKRMDVLVLLKLLPGFLGYLAAKYLWRRR